MKITKKGIALLLAVAVAAMTLTACSSLLPTEEDVMPPPISKPEEATYNTKPVALGDIQNVKYCVGSFKSTSEEEMAFQLDQGTFYRFLVQKGDYVKKGDVLAEAENTTIAERIEALEDSMYRSNLQSSYELNRLKQGLDSSKSKLNAQKTALSDLEASAAALKKTIAEDEAALEAAKALTTEDINPDTLEPYTEDELAAIADAAQVKLDTDKNELASREASIKSMKEAISDAENNLALEQQYYNMQKTFIDMDKKKNNEQLAEYKAQLAETQLKAPFDGKIINLASLLVGDLISKDVPVLTICDPDSLQFEYEVKEKEIYDQFYSGREVMINVNGIEVAGSIVQGTADVSSERLESDPTTHIVYIKCPNIPDKISMGNMGGMNIVIEEQRNVIVVDAAYIYNTGYGDNVSYFCYILEDGLPVLRNVTVGIKTTAVYEITEGLQVGDEIVTNY